MVYIRGEKENSLVDFRIFSVLKNKVVKLVKMMIVSFICKTIQLVVILVSFVVLVSFAIY